MLRAVDYWQRDLAKVANKLTIRLVQRQWREASYYQVEKEIFNGFFAVRKLLESGEISNQFQNEKYEITEYPVSMPISKATVEDGFSIKKGKKVNLNAREISNQFIHSYFFMPTCIHSSLVGFYICSDYKQKSGVYYLTIFDVVELFRKVAGKKGLVD